MLKYIIIILIIIKNNHTVNFINTIKSYNNKYPKLFRYGSKSLPLILMYYGCKQYDNRKSLRVFTSIISGLITFSITSNDIKKLKSENIRLGNTLQENEEANGNKIELGENTDRLENNRMLLINCYQYGSMLLEILPMYFSFKKEDCIDSCYLPLSCLFISYVIQECSYRLLMWKYKKNKNVDLEGLLKFNQLIESLKEKSSLKDNTASKYINLNEKEVESVAESKKVESVAESKENFNNNFNNNKTDFFLESRNNYRGHSKAIPMEPDLFYGYDVSEVTNKEKFKQFCLYLDENKNNDAKTLLKNQLGIQEYNEKFEENWITILNTKGLAFLTGYKKRVKASEEDGVVVYDYIAMTEKEASEKIKPKLETMISFWQDLEGDYH